MKKRLGPTGLNGNVGYVSNEEYNRRRDRSLGYAAGYNGERIKAGASAAWREGYGAAVNIVSSKTGGNKCP